MKTIAYWSPFLTNVATISAVINSAKSLKLYSKSYKPVIINACGEFSTYKDDLKKQGVELINLIPFNYHKFLFKEGFIKSRISYLIIFFLSFIPLIYFIIKNKPDYFICHLITSLPILISKIIPKKTKFILRISGLPKLNLFRKFYWSCFGNNMFLVTCPTIGTCNEIKNKNLFEQKKIILLRDPVIKINNICKQKNKKIDFKIEEKNFNIVCVGRLTKQKNFAFIINNFQNLIKLKPNSKLYILGDGEQKKYFENGNLDSISLGIGFSFF